MWKTPNSLTHGPRRWLVLLFLAPLVGTHAFAATITVDDPLPGISANGLCSLIEAIVNANDDAPTHADCLAGSGADIIELDAGGATYTLDESVDPLHGGNGLPLITSEITMNGHDSIVERDPGDPDRFRILGVTETGNLTLNDLTLQGGSPDPSGFEPYGGALRNKGGTLRLDGCTVRDSSATFGGGILSDCPLGDACDSGTAAGELFLVNSEVSGNTATEEGGGIYSFHNELASIVGSTISNNAAVGQEGGGAFLKSLTSEVEKSTFLDNTSGGSGGGLYIEASNRVTSTSLVEESTFSGNTAGFAGGTIAFGTGGGITIFGGGTHAIVNSTLSGNTALDTGNGGLVEAEGGGLSVGNFFAEITTVLVDSSTIADNAAAQGGEAVSVFRTGGAPAPATATFHNSILDGPAVKAPGDNCSVDGNPDIVIASQGYNLSSDTSCGFNETGDDEGVDPLLSDLALNGGPTPTHELETGSPAIDSGTVADCPATDQRGFSRPFDGDGDDMAVCDKGAVETGLIFLDGFESGDT